MESPNRVDTEQAETRATLADAIAKAKEVCQRLQDQTAAAAKATDQTIREHPYQAMAIGLGLGLLVGFLVVRSRRD